MENISKLKNAIAFVDEKIDGLVFEASDRNRVAASLFDISNEHIKAIVLLFDSKFYASSLSLVRSMFETFIRAIWLLECASEKQFKRYVRKDRIQSIDLKKDMHFGDLLKEVEKQKVWPDTLTQLKNAAWKSMSSYTHGGFQHVARRASGVYIESSITNEELRGITNFCALILLLCFGEMIQLSKTNLDAASLELYVDVSSWALT
jgi:hypothetical protein